MSHLLLNSYMIQEFHPFFEQNIYNLHSIKNMNTCKKYICSSMVTKHGHKFHLTPHTIWYFLLSYNNVTLVTWTINMFCEVRFRMP